MLTSSKSNQLSPLHCLRLESFIRNLARQKLHQVPSLSKLEISSISDKFPGSVARRYVQDVWSLQTLPFLDVNSEKLEWQRENSFRSKLALRWGPGPWPRGANPLWKNVLDIVKKFTPPSENSSPPLVSQAGYMPAEAQVQKAISRFLVTKISEFYPVLWNNVKM